MSKVMKSSSQTEIQDVVGENYSILLDCGFTKPVIHVKIEDKIEIIEAVALHSVILRTKAEIDQFADGLQSCGVLDAIRHNGSVTRSFFTIGGSPKLTTEQILAIFKEVRYSECGSSERKKEVDTYSLFVEYLDDCEKETFSAGEPNEGKDFQYELSRVSLGTVLNFFTGAEEIPPMGYDVVVGPYLSFNNSSPYPTASTCAIELTLPTKYFNKPYSDFKGIMDTAMTCHGGFGLA